MKKDDVEIGKEYRTYVSGILVKVIVTGTHKNSNNRTEFKVKRSDNGRELQPRSAAALRK